MGKEPDFRTEDYEEDREIMSAGKIPKAGIIIVPEEKLTERDGKHGTFYSLPCLRVNETEEVPAVLNFSSKRLKKLIVENWEQISGKEILVCGKDEGFNRHYSVSIVQRNVVE